MLETIDRRRGGAVVEKPRMAEFPAGVALRCCNGVIHADFQLCVTSSTIGPIA
jgi:hypothetical protein